MNTHSYHDMSAQSNLNPGPVFFDREALHDPSFQNENLYFQTQTHFQNQALPHPGFQQNCVLENRATYFMNQKNYSINPNPGFHFQKTTYQTPDSNFQHPSHDYKVPIFGNPNLDIQIPQNSWPIRHISHDNNLGQQNQHIFHDQNYFKSQIFSDPTLQITHPKLGRTNVHGHFLSNGQDPYSQISNDMNHITYGQTPKYVFNRDQSSISNQIPMTNDVSLNCVKLMRDICSLTEYLTRSTNESIDTSSQSTYDPIHDLIESDLKADKLWKQKILLAAQLDSDSDSEDQFTELAPKIPHAIPYPEPQISETLHSHDSLPKLVSEKP